MKRLTHCVGRECRQVTPPMPMTRKEFQRFQAEKRREIRERERERARRKRERDRR